MTPGAVEAPETELLRGAEAGKTELLPYVVTPPDETTLALRDPWADPTTALPPTPADDAATHDPHEVTVQLDAVQIGDGRLSAAVGVPAPVDQDAAGPVFVDETGRRSRRFRRIGMLVGLACAVYAVVIVATLMSGSSDAPSLPVPEQRDQPASQVDTSDRPTDSAPASGSGDADSGASPDGSADTAVSPDAAATGPGANEEPGGPAVTGPDPTVTITRPGGTATRPGGGSTATEDPTATDDPADPDPTDTAPDPDPTGTSGEDTGGGDTTGTAADALRAAPVTLIPSIPSPHFSSSPEYVL
ncbi:hypothetical protein [Streptomyces flavalbus]|uniref:Uncharacterized protein n=1 Tax=Streptomyces flavalbus TaxID=2665155 RepID=A0ABW2W795_9ACTN